MKRPLTTSGEQAGIRQTLEVMAQCGGGKIDVRLYLARRHSRIAELHDEAQDREAHGVTERAQLLRGALQFRGHRLLLTNSKKGTSLISIILEMAVIDVEI